MFVEFVIQSFFYLIYLTSSIKSVKIKWMVKNKSNQKPYIFKNNN